MARPRKVLTPTATSDPQTLAADVLHEVFSVLREHGVNVPLSVTIAAAQAVEKLLPNNGSHAQEGEPCST
jgi:hypothetical protein